MADWRQIQARIRKAKTSSDPAVQLVELFERTRDAMVAFELAQWHEKAGNAAETVQWYTAAAQRFRRAQWRTKAEEALTRLGAPIPEPIPAEAPKPAGEGTGAGSTALRRSSGQATESSDAAPGLPYYTSMEHEQDRDGLHAGDGMETSALEAPESAEEGAAPAAAGSAEGGAVAGKRRRRGRRGGRKRRGRGGAGQQAAGVEGAARETAPGVPRAVRPVSARPFSPARSGPGAEEVSSEAPSPAEHPSDTGEGEASEARVKSFEGQGRQRPGTSAWQRDSGGPVSSASAGLTTSRSRAGDPGLSSRIAQLESQLRRLLACPLGSLDEADQAPAGPGVLLLSDSDQVTHYYIEACQTLRIGIGNLVRGGRGSKGASQLKPSMAEHLGISDSRVSKYLKDHCAVRWIQLDEGAGELAHFAMAVLRPVVRE